MADLPPGSPGNRETLRLDTLTAKFPAIGPPDFVIEDHPREGLSGGAAGDDFYPALLSAASLFDFTMR